MDAPSQEPADPAATPVAPPPLARRDPDYAERDQESEPPFPYPRNPALPETTRSRRLAATRAFLLDATVSLREMLTSGARRLRRRRRLVAGGALLGAIAFALGVWVGAAWAGSRWKAKSAAAGAEARARIPETSREVVTAPAPVAAPAAAGAPAAAAPGVPPAETGSAPRQPTRRRAEPTAEPALARPAPIEKPTAAAEPAATAEPSQEPPQAVDRMPGTRQTAMARPPEPPDAEAAGGPTPAASPDRAPDTGPAASPEPAPPADAER